MKNLPLIEAVCCYFDCGNTTILGKKTSDIGVGLWNGYGGKIKPLETPEQTAVREISEETDGVWVMEKHLIKVGEIYCHNRTNNGSKFIVKVHIFMVFQWGGEVKETEEMLSPKEFSKNNLPYNEMMASDKDWLPLILIGKKKIIAHVFLGQNQETKIGETRIEFVDSF